MRSRLEKYRRPRFGVLTKQYNIKLPDDLANELERICSDLDMTPPEFIRLLIYEEIQALKIEKIPEDIHKYSSISTSTREYPITTSQPEQRKPRRSAPAGVRFTYAPWEVGGKLPCSICGNWYQSSTFSGRHAKDHDFINTKDYFARNIEKINQMYKEKTGNEPEYNPDMLK